MTRVVAAVALLVAMLLAFGQEADAQKKAKGQLPPGWKDLGLSDAQKEQVYKTRAEYKAKLDALKEQEKNLHTAAKTDLVKLPIPDQKQTLAVLDTCETKNSEEKKSEK